MPTASYKFDFCFIVPGWESYLIATQLIITKNNIKLLHVFDKWSLTNTISSIQLGFFIALTDIWQKSEEIFFLLPWQIYHRNLKHYPCGKSGICPKIYLLSHATNKGLQVNKTGVRTWRAHEVIFPHSNSNLHDPITQDTQHHFPQ